MRIDLSDDERETISEALEYRRERFREDYPFIDGADAKRVIRTEYRILIRLLGVRHLGKLNRVYPFDDPCCAVCGEYASEHTTIDHTFVLEPGYTYMNRDE